MKTGSVLVWTGQQTPSRIRSHWWEGYGLASSLLRQSSWQPFIAPLTFNAMTKKTLSEFSAPSTSQVPVGHAVNTGDVNFENKTGLINMVQASPFCGKANEDASAHLQQFLELSGTFTIRGVSEDAIRLRLFPFSLLERGKQWFYANQETINSWDKCSAAFLVKFFL